MLLMRNCGDIWAPFRVPSTAITPKHLLSLDIASMRGRIVREMSEWKGTLGDDTHVYQQPQHITCDEREEHCREWRFGALRRRFVGREDDHQWLSPVRFRFRHRLVVLRWVTRMEMCSKMYKTHEHTIG